MSEMWLKCEVLKGMFSDERAIRFRLKNHSLWSEFVPSSEVVGDLNHVGRVRVKVFTDESGHQWTVLPTEYRDSFIVDPAELVTP